MVPSAAGPEKWAKADAVLDRPGPHRVHGNAFLDRLSGQGAEE
ncbi:uncharacterized protein SAZU_0470 [Streptomyces azureus]|uniref:Uncharacterized protein n=1 Tax=Streptomyces azureus TaxID=146537 RepID=A0A0K8PCZ6_STRAJ|nr:uncharacterized protein SAZU_0470 [Streptomyces azureus]